MAKFDHSSPMFATIAQYDRLVTVWYRSKTTNANQIHYDFVFLSHPRHVTHFVWRKLPQNSHDCTLFTMARDGIGRFWSPVDLEQMHKLYLCAVIDPCQSLVTAEPASEDGSIAHIDHGEDFSPIHYIGCDELSSSLFRDFQHHSKHERLDHSLDRMRNMVRDTPDLLFRLQSDGSLIFWGVQHLNCSPRRVPRVFVVLRIAQAIDASDITYFLNPVHVLHDYSHIQSSSIVKPVELSLLAINPHGQLRCYGLNLLDFLDSTSFIPRLHLKYNWLGHQHAIRSLQQAQNNRFSTVGVDGQINIWKYALHEWEIWCAVATE
ncbi:uncharacterized protein BYT42DRAFT_109870 [Radiomyces spectabilis]|uniref:uncharacterized protein n=1 Tax=Radiomyces spectabilis TaxID=64574 RepID=UPI00221FE264|nr:uncharacterized protein BYT42DRAFT_109870 [Radiomyces spectabilis]KAI8369423.1 hypothetical protein BYT42DRAFT_109870 [Radiomyces spectabilis]